MRIVSDVEKKALRKYRAWVKTGGGPPRLSDEVLEVILDTLKYTRDVLLYLPEEYRLASRALTYNLLDLENIQTTGLEKGRTHDETTR